MVLKLEHFVTYIEMPGKFLNMALQKDGEE